MVITYTIQELTAIGEMVLLKECLSRVAHQQQEEQQHQKQQHHQEQHDHHQHQKEQNSAVDSTGVVPVPISGSDFIWLCSSFVSSKEAPTTTSGR